MESLEWPEPRIDETLSEHDLLTLEEIYGQLNAKIEDFLDAMRVYAESPEDLTHIRERLMARPDYEERKDKCPQFVRYLKNLGTIIDCVKSCTAAGAHIWGDESLEDEEDEEDIEESAA